MKHILFMIKLIVLVGSLLVVSLVSWELFKFMTYPIASEEKNARIIEITPGSTAKELAHELSQKGLMSSPNLFVWLLKIKGVDKKLRVGEYLIKPNWNVTKLIQYLKKGESIQYRYTLIPGTNFKVLWSHIRWFRNLSHEPGLTKEKLRSKLRLNIPLEGLFLPDTYSYQKFGDTDFKMFLRMHKHLMQFLQEQWELKDQNLPLKSPYEALILASIVEKEAARKDELPLIAGVFINRLRKGMRLQSDPTVIYGMGERYDGNIRKSDLREKTAYNTYRINGLPPTPIAMASKLAIIAVLHPTKTQALYFVAKGKGRHQFSKTLKEHNSAVRRYQLRR